MHKKNKERRNARTSLIIMVIGMLAAVLPFALNADMESFGFGVSFIGAILALTCFFVYLMFNGRAKVFDRMFHGENVLAHWSYSKEFWEKERQKDSEDSGIARVVGFFLGGIFALIGIVFLISDPDDNGVLFLIMLGIGLFFVLIGFISAASEKRRAATMLPEAIIAREGVLYKDILYTWNSPKIAFLVSVSMDSVSGDSIVFVLRQLSGGRGTIRYHKTSVSIPVPPGEEAAAGNIVRYFDMEPSPDASDRTEEEASLEENEG
ncbi:MAG: hypothetical protein ACYCYM_07270 [Saccharofermentanales bacterium]